MKVELLVLKSTATVPSNIFIVSPALSFINLIEIIAIVVSDVFSLPQHME